MAHYRVLDDDAQIRQVAWFVEKGYQAEVCSGPRVLTGSSAILWWYDQFRQSGVASRELRLLPRCPEIIDLITRDASGDQDTTQMTVQVGDGLEDFLSLLPYHSSGRDRVAYARSESTVGELGGVWVMSLDSMMELLKHRVRELKMRPADSHGAAKNLRMAIRKADHDIAVLERMSQVYRQLVEKLTYDERESAPGVCEFWAKETTMTRFFARHRSAKPAWHPSPDSFLKEWEGASVARRLSFD